jgi:hypothetical protein
MAITEKHQTASFWTGHLQQWKESGQSQAAYCRQQGLSQQKFSYQKRKSRALCIIDPAVSSGFSRVQINTAPLPGLGLSLRLNNGMCIEGIAESNLLLVQPLLAVLQ